MKDLLYGLGIFFLLSSAGCATPKSSPPTFDILRFEEAIQLFEKDDARSKYLPGSVLFTGSSSIRFWQTLQNDMGDVPCINRGFGGSTMPEVNYYFDRIITKFKPAVIVLYCGENDMAAGREPSDVVRDYRAFVKKTRASLPNTKIIYLSMKPSPSRWHLWDKYQVGNAAIKKITGRDKKQYFIDVGEGMLKADGEPNPSIFIDDMLHMNRSGYEGWKNIIQPVVQQVYNSN